MWLTKLWVKFIQTYIPGNFIQFLDNMQALRPKDIRVYSRLKVDGTSFSDTGSLVTTAHLMCEICPRDLKYKKSKTNMGAQKLLHTRCLFSCLSEIGSKQKLSFGRQLLSNSVCIRKTLFVAQCPKFKARVSISVAINLVGNRDQ